MIGTTATSKPVVELDSRRSAFDSSSHGATISTSANTTSHRQYGSRTRICRRRRASGSSRTAATEVRANTSTGTETPSSATLMSR